ncbi:MAG: hypothetical protein JO040_14425, partial [Gemmatimonadetes bacterium]|nr:hypothetical protein [Gemmatimonadota bacterium]
MRVLQVGCALDPRRRGGEELLEAWPTLPAVARAVSRAGAEVVVLQAAHADAVVERDGVTFRFVAEPRIARVPGTRGPAGVLPLRLARAAAVLKPEVIHLGGLAFPLHARALATSGVPVLARDHASAPPARNAAVHRWGHARVAA